MRDTGLQAVAAAFRRRVEIVPPFTGVPLSGE
jgi:hypothetical protein